jgi:hypothetical protein
MQVNVNKKEDNKVGVREQLVAVAWSDGHGLVPDDVGFASFDQEPQASLICN